MGIILVKGDNVFKIDNELKSANIAFEVGATIAEEAAENGISFNLLVLQCCKYALDDMREDESAI